MDLHQQVSHSLLALNLKKQVFLGRTQKVLIFTTNHANMKLFKLTAFSSILFTVLFSLNSCQNDDELAKTTDFAKTSIVMSGAQVVPASTTNGLGSMDVTYSRTTKILTYKLNWSGLSDSVIAIRVNAPAPVSFSALNLSFPAWTATPGFRPFADTTTPYANIQQFTNGIFASPSLGVSAKGLYAASGSYSGTLLVDGVKVKEVDLLNGLYYVTVHTKTLTGILTPPIPTAAEVQNATRYRWYGEIRAQIVFQ